MTGSAQPSGRRKRGALGWTFLALFVAWNVYGAWSAWESWAGAAEGRNTIGVDRILEVWGWGALILAVPLLLTRGRRW
jgi:hypothetical protein